jgi:hypothetical protein
MYLTLGAHCSKPKKKKVGQIVITKTYLILLNLYQLFCLLYQKGFNVIRLKL